MGCGSAKQAKGASIFHRSSLNITDDILKKYDKNENGVLEASELHALLKDAFPKEGITEQDADTLLKGLDSNKDGKIAVNELRAIMRCLNPDTQKLERKSALIIVDVQNDFISGSLANPYNGEEIVPIINDIRDKFDVVVISYDWHPHDHCSFVEAANDKKVPIKDPQEEYEAFKMVTLLADDERPEHQQMLYPRHAVQNSEGGKCHKDLVLKDSDLKIYKGTKPNIDSYSAFFDNGKYNDTGLTAMLEKEHVTDVYCCGLVTDICVKSTALHGAEGGFNVVVIEDASKPLSMDNMEETKKQLADAGVEVMSAQAAAEAVANTKKESTIKEYIAAIRKSTGAKQIHAAASLSSHAVSGQA